MDWSDRLIGIVIVVLLAGLVVVGSVRNDRIAGSSPSRAVVALAGGSPATRGTAPPLPSTTIAPPSTSTTTLPAGPVTTVGDSIMLDIQPELEALIPGVRVDGLVSRQFTAGIAVVQADREAGTLGNVLVVELGTNGTVTPDNIDAMMQAAAGVQRVVFVNVNVPRPWMAPDNAVLTDAVARYPKVAVLADWATLSAPHPEWFTADQVHLNPAGAAALAGLIAHYA